MDDSAPIAIDCEQNCAVLLQEQDNGVVVSAIAIQ
jgi:hypothetical protein